MKKSTLLSTPLVPTCKRKLDRGFSCHIPFFFFFLFDLGTVHSACSTTSIFFCAERKASIMGMETFSLYEKRPISLKKTQMRVRRKKKSITNKTNEMHMGCFKVKNGRAKGRCWSTKQEHQMPTQLLMWELGG